jgi:hypothetical protein
MACYKWLYDKKFSLTINTPGKASQNTNTNFNIGRQLGINQGEQLDWPLAKFGDELVLVVRKEVRN